MRFFLDIYDLGDKENINNLINQWDEEDIPLSEPQANKDFIQVMQNIKDSEDLVGGSSSKSANDSINNLNNKGITIENTTAQIVPAEDGAYLLVDDVDMSGNVYLKSIFQTFNFENYNLYLHLNRRRNTIRYRKN